MAKFVHGVAMMTAHIVHHFCLICCFGLKRAQACSSLSDVSLVGEAGEQRVMSGVAEHTVGAAEHTLPPFYKRHISHVFAVSCELRHYAHVICKKLRE